MAGGLSVNTGAMNTNGKDTIANAELFANELSSLRNNIESLMTIWRGLSANEFNNSYQEQAQNLQAFQQLLYELGERITEGANILNRTEEDNASAGARLF
ncbi:MAG: WXG100 family type VII secretion target [Mycoplasmatota bacterium]|nr:WXG100 family type VII secretion target [Mycoplasmatota bacterium]